MAESVSGGEGQRAPSRESLLRDERLRTEVAIQARREVALLRRESVPLTAKDRRDFGVMLLIVIGAWLALGSMWIYPTSVDGQFGSIRDALAAVVVVTCGFQLKLAARPSPIAGGLALLSGLALIAFGLLLGQSSTGAQVQEIACGVLIVLGAGLAARRP